MLRREEVGDVDVLFSRGDVLFEGGKQYGDTFLATLVDYERHWLRHFGKDIGEDKLGHFSLRLIQNERDGVTLLIYNHLPLGTILGEI